MLKVYEGPAIRALYEGLVREYGGYDAAAAVLNLNKGTISKQIDGTANIAPVHFATLEDHLGRYPITNLLAGRAGRKDAACNRTEAALALIKESGEANAAIAAVLVGGDARSAIKELQESLDATKAALAALMAEDDE